MAPMWERVRVEFLKWWQAIADAQRARGETLTIDPEYGPPTYLPVDAEGAPVSDLWENCTATKTWLESHLS